jgi:hypothetical protein
MQLTSFLALLASLPLSLCGRKTDFDCGFSLHKDLVPNSHPCTDNYVMSLGIMDTDQCRSRGGNYFYCDKLNKVYPYHCLVSLYHLFWILGFLHEY